MASLWPGSLQVSLHPQLSGRVRRTGQADHNTFQVSLLPYSAWGKGRCGKNVMKEVDGELAVLGGHLTSGFLLG